MVDADLVVDPQDVVIYWLLAQSEIAELVETRVAPRHEYGEGGAWKREQQGITVRYDGGSPELYVTDHANRWDIRFYGVDDVATSDLYRAFVGAVRRFNSNGNSAVVAIPDGDNVGNNEAYIRELIIVSQPSDLTDPVTEMPYKMLIIETMIAEAYIPVS